MSYRTGQVYKKKEAPDGGNEGRKVQRIEERLEGGNRR